MKKIVIIVGSSGSGKNTIIDALKVRDDFVNAVTDATRPPRPGDKEGVTYYFISETEFKIRKAEGKYIDTTFYSGSYRGLRKEELDKKLATNKNVLLIMDKNGVVNLKSIYGDDVVAINITCPIEVQVQRMRARGDSEDAIAERVAYFKENETNNNDYCDVVIENVGSVEDTVEKIVSYLN